MNETMTMSDLERARELVNQEKEAMRKAVNAYVAAADGTEARANAADEIRFYAAGALASQQIVVWELEKAVARGTEKRRALLTAQDELFEAGLRNRRALALPA